MENVISVLVRDILAKKELRNLDEKFVKEKVEKHLKNNKKLREKIQKQTHERLQRAKEYKELVKAVRAELREIYGVFILKGYAKLPELLEELKNEPSIANHNKILKLHKSSKERLPYYSLVYKKIFEIIGKSKNKAFKPTRIIDLACGLNPFSYPYISNLGCEPEYLACDLADKDLEFIKKYFKIMKIKGKVKKINLIKSNLIDVENPKEVENNNAFVLLLKTLDSLETVKRNISEKILKNIKAKYIVVSFSTKSLGGRKAISKDRRVWFEKLIEKNNWKKDFFEIPNEIFYVITK